MWTTAEGRVAAYFGLAPHLIENADLPRRLGRGDPRQIPAILLARLALSGELRGTGRADPAARRPFPRGGGEPAGGWPVRRRRRHRRQRPPVLRALRLRRHAAIRSPGPHGQRHRSRHQNGLSVFERLLNIYQRGSRTASGFLADHHYFPGRGGAPGLARRSSPSR